MTWGRWAAYAAAVTARERDRAERLYRLVGLEIRRLREAGDRTQKDLAAAIGRSRTTVTNVESGHQRLPLHQLLEVADELGVAIVGVPRPA